MSDLIDRYLAAVAANLPKADRADIAAELGDVLNSKAEAREAELGRELTAKEIEALLKDFGHPLEVAGRYGKAQQLIGPAVYPFYIFALKATLGIIVALHVVDLVLGQIIGRGGGRHVFDDLFGALLVAFALVTLAAAAIDRAGAADKLLRKWKPSQLPVLGAPNGRSPWEVLFELIVVALAILWWVGLVRFPDPSPSGVDLSLAPIWAQVYWPILILLLAQLALDIFELALPGLARIHALGRMVWHVVGLIPLAALLQASHWIDIAEVASRPGLAQTLEANFNRGFRVGLLIALLIFLYEAGRSGLRAARLGWTPRRAAA